MRGRVLMRRCLAGHISRPPLRFPVLLQALNLPPRPIPRTRTLMTFTASTKPTQNAGADETVRLQRVDDRKPVRFVSEAPTCPSFSASGRCSRDDGRRTRIAAARSLTAAPPKGNTRLNRTDRTGRSSNAVQ
jgi:hypothetical protein